MNGGFGTLLRALVDQQVRFIIIGGVAATVHGSARHTRDIDLVYARDDQNVSGIVTALAPYAPYLRGAPAGLPFRWDMATIRAGLNFTLTTSVSDVDFLGEVVGGGRYEDLLHDTVEIEAFGVRARCVTLSKLIVLKRAAGRPKDNEILAELQALLALIDERGGTDQ
jgi:predicted nucleotidyltransferase